MKVPWPTLYGQTPTLKKKTLLSLLGMNRPVFPPFHIHDTIYPLNVIP